MCVRVGTKIVKWKICSCRNVGTGRARAIPLSLVRANRVRLGGRSKGSANPRHWLGVNLTANVAQTKVIKCSCRNICGKLKTARYCAKAGIKPISLKSRQLFHLRGYYSGQAPTHGMGRPSKLAAKHHLLLVWFVPG